MVVAGRFLWITSKAKNTPDKGALNPLDTPAAAPHAKYSRFLRTRAAVFTTSSSVTRSNCSGHASVPNLLTAMPISTPGPSGPREQPVPSVNIAAQAFRKESPSSKSFDFWFIFIASRSTSLTTPLTPGGNSPSPTYARTDTAIPPSTGMRKMGM